jgi:hypothetical protein
MGMMISKETLEGEFVDGVVLESKKRKAVCFNDDVVVGTARDDKQ